MEDSLKNPHEKLAKAMLLQYLLQRGSLEKEAAIINELSLEFFSRRADIALINNGIEIFEIKSEADTLNRLPGQIETFSRFCDKLHIVSAPCHIDKILRNTPQEVAVWQLDTKRGIIIVRRGKKNILRNKKSLLKLLNAKELKQFLKRINIKTESSRRKHLDKAVQIVPSEKLREGVLLALKARYSRTTAEFINTVSAANIVEPTHLLLLKKKNLLEKNRNISENMLCTNINLNIDDVYMSQLVKQHDNGIFGTVPEDIRQLIDKY